MSSSDRPPRAYLSESAPRQTAPPIDSTEWRLWLRAQLLAHGYARQTEPNHIKYYLLRLEQDIARLQPDAPVSIDTLRSVVYRNVLPLHRTARGLPLRSASLRWRCCCGAANSTGTPSSRCWIYRCPSCAQVTST